MWINKYGHPGLDAGIQWSGMAGVKTYSDGFFSGAKKCITANLIQHYHPWRLDTCFPAGTTSTAAVAVMIPPEEKSKHY